MRNKNMMKRDGDEEPTAMHACHKMIEIERKWIGQERCHAPGGGESGAKAHHAYTPVGSSSSLLPKHPIQTPLSPQKWRKKKNNNNVKYLNKVHRHAYNGNGSLNVTSSV